MSKTKKELTRLIKERDVFRNKIIKIMSKIEENLELKKSLLEAYHEDVKIWYKEFLDTQIDIELLDDTRDQEIIREELDELYFQCREIMIQRIEEVKTANKINPVSETQEKIAVVTNTNVLLPKIQIKPFGGSLLDWHSFFDTFKSLVHDSDDLPMVQKFHFLKNSLVSEAASVIASLNASEEGYLIAWDLLKRRYDQPRQIIHAHIQSLIEFPEISYESPSLLMQLAENMRVHVNALKALNQPAKYKDAFLIYLITKKFDKIPRRAWERTLENNEMPSLQELFDFLDKQVRGGDFESKKFSTPIPQD